MNVTVFLGPSLPLDEARRILPDANFRPPAEQGDVLAAVERDGAQVIGLIDGTFLQTLSVWHNELCYVLSRRITVYGASSMGALRAVETERFGCVGVGRIYEWYRDGVLNSDDEVALAHGDSTSGFRQMSLPLVNIRASFETAVSKGLFDESIAMKAIQIVRRIYFPERTLGLILRRWREGGISGDLLDAMKRALTIDYVDLKQSDARELLLRVQRDLSTPGSLPVPAPFRFARSSVFEAMYNLDRRVVHDGIEVPLQRIGEYLALHNPRFDEIRRSALNHRIVAYLAKLLDVKVSADDLAKEEAEFLTALGIGDGEKLIEWIRANDLNQDDFRDMLFEMAVCRRMQRWIQHARGFDRGSRCILDELRRRGIYTEWATRAAKEYATADAFREQSEYQTLGDVDPQELAEKHAATTGVQIAGDARVWASDAGFDGTDGLRTALERSVIAHDVQRRIDGLLGAISKIPSPV
jgi:hypothetical protein